MVWFFRDDNKVDYLEKQILYLSTKVEKLEIETKYLAEKPETIYESLFSLQNYNPDRNAVPINDVVKAIVKHLGIDIEKVEAKVTHAPQEVKVAEKQSVVSPLIVSGSTGVTSWVSTTTTTKPKRVYKKRKPVAKKVAKQSRGSKNV